MISLQEKQKKIKLKKFGYLLFIKCSFGIIIIWENKNGKIEIN